MRGRLYLEHSEIPVGRIGRSPRINVDYAGDWASKRWRFYERGNRYVSVRRATSWSEPSADGAAGRETTVIFLNLADDHRDTLGVSRRPASGDDSRRNESLLGGASLFGPSKGKRTTCTVSRSRCRNVIANQVVLVMAPTRCSGPALSQCYLACVAPAIVSGP